EAAIAGTTRKRQVAPGLVPGGASDDLDEPAGTSQRANDAAARDSDRPECIPFRTPRRYLQAKPSSQEAA
ncbi:MAG TPA: hypothetical protein VFW87_15215, partial [Pirellulales bacterium]|nr:hypothetical protein [Pirellulales bacterium]